MSLINELDIDFNRCFEFINTHLLIDDPIEKDISRIELKIFIDNVSKLLEENSQNISEMALKKYRDYLSLCEGCLSIDKTFTNIDELLYKEDYLSEEVYRYLIIQMESVGKKMDNLCNGKYSTSICGFLNQVSAKYYNYIRVIRNKLAKKKVK